MTGSALGKESTGFPGGSAEAQPLGILEGLPEQRARPVGVTRLAAGQERPSQVHSVVDHEGAPSMTLHDRLRVLEQRNRLRVATFDEKQVSDRTLCRTVEKGVGTE